MARITPPKVGAIAEAEARGFTRGVLAVVNILRGYRGAVDPMCAISDAKRLLEKTP